MALLQSKVALITGGSRGIGKGIVERFVEEGADVAFTFVSNAEKANALAAELAVSGQKVMAIQSDAADMTAAQAAVDQVVNALPGAGAAGSANAIAAALWAGIDAEERKCG